MGLGKLIILLAGIFLFSADLLAADTVFSDEVFSPPLLPEAEYIGMGLIFIEGTSGQVMEDVEAIIEYDDGERAIVYAPAGISMQMPLGKKHFMVILEDMRTPEPDYISGYYDAEAGSKTITMAAVGSVRGVVYLGDERQPDVDVTYQCGSQSGSIGKTNGLGFYSGHFVPVGSCRIAAESGEFSASEAIRVKRGEQLDADLTLERSGIGAAVYILSAANLFLFGFIAYMALGRKKKKPGGREGGKSETAAAPEREDLETDRNMGDTAESPEPSQQSEEYARLVEGEVDRVRTVLRTLSGRQREIIELLLLNKGELLQSKIYHDLQVPKTSLIREIEALEKRDIVHCEDFGKTKKVHLSKWFYPPELKEAEFDFGDKVDLKLELTDGVRAKLEILDKRQRKIVQLLLEHGGSLLQSRIMKETMIPKSTLVRLINDLKIKGIVETGKFRKTKRVELTKGFLGRRNEE